MTELLGALAGWPPERLRPADADSHGDVALYLRWLSRWVRQGRQKDKDPVNDFVMYRLERWAIAVERRDVAVMAEALRTARAAAKARDYPYALEAYSGAESVLAPLVEGRPS